jgi:Ion channel
MAVFAAILGLLLIAIVLVDAFDTIVLPRRVTRTFAPSRLFVLGTWRGWSWLASRLQVGDVRRESGRRDDFLGIFAPLALVLTVGLWAWSLVLGFALLLWGTGVPMSGAGVGGAFGSTLYLSGITFFTVGFGDVIPGNAIGRIIAVVEGSMGFGFLAIIISYLPTIFGASARREASITRLDARAGSPPTAAAFLCRMGNDPGAFDQSLREWEEWSADLLESHLSYPILMLFRSQHERQSWLATLTLILDISSLAIVGLGPADAPLPRRQARNTFAIARHALGDLSQVLGTSPRPPYPDRLPACDREQLLAQLAGVGLPLAGGEQAMRQLAALRALYEPYATAIADRTLLDLPAWLPEPDAVDDWQTTAWQQDPAAVRQAFGDEP